MDTGAWSGEAQGARARQVGLALAAIAMIICSNVLGGWASPFHYLDAFAIVAIAILPALAVLAGFVMLDHGAPRGLVAGGARTSWIVVPLALFGVIALPCNLVLYANQRLDTSPAVLETAPVIDTWIRRARRGPPTYMTGVATRITSPLGCLSLYDSQPIGVARRAWTTIVPGRTHLVLREHRGVFGFPWFEPEPA